MHFTGLLNNTFTIRRLAPTSDGHGNWTETYVTIGTAAGRLRPTGSADVEVAGHTERQVTYVLYVPATTDIARGDQVTCGDVTVEVLGVREPSLAGHHLEVDCVARQATVSV